VAVALLLAVIWAVVLVPPAWRAHAARKEAFIVSFGQPSEPAAAPPVRAPQRRSARVQRRRRIAGGLLVAMVTTLLMGLLPTFRVLLVVHLFLVDSFLAYVALLAHMAGQAARAAARQAAPEVVAPATPVARAPRWRPRRGSGPVVLPDFGIAPLA
jgi:predicted lipid-binding transport protein (Tim44 family)